MINDIGLLYCFGLEKDVGLMKNFISAIIITGVGLVAMATGVYASPVSDALRNGVNNKATGVDVSSCGLTVNQASPLLKILFFFPSLKRVKAHLSRGF